MGKASPAFLPEKRQMVFFFAENVIYIIFVGLRNLVGGMDG